MSTNMLVRSPIRRMARRNVGQMPVVACANLKGGVGKTTSAVMLALAAHRAGYEVALVDLDPQASAVGWDNDADGGLGFLVLGAATRRARPLIEQLAGQHQVVVVDTPPGEGDMPLVSAALAAATVVVVPTQPSRMDEARLVRMLDMASAMDVPTAVLVTRTDERWTDHRALLEALGESEDVSVLATSIPERRWVARAVGTVPDDLGEYAAVWAELAAALDLEGARAHG